MKQNRFAVDMTRTDQLVGALALARFGDTAKALALGEPVNMRNLVLMLRWAVLYYRDERPVMARALRCAKALARERRP